MNPQFPSTFEVRMRRLLRVFPIAMLALSLISLALTPKAGKTVPLYAARTGLMCQSCHFDPNGGGPRNEFGFNYAKNRHSLEADTTGEWKDLDLSNRVSANFPLYFGVNQRFMLLADQLQKSKGVDRAGFFNMENAIYTTFQPHPRLTLVYSRDGFNAGSTTKDAFGMIGVTPDVYLKAGQFRTPFGLRMDDHTVATRNSFLDVIGGSSFLPYDPRKPDQGLEVGGAFGSMFGRVAVLNGGSNPLGSDPNHSQAVAAKLGGNLSHYQGGFSFYDNWSDQGPGNGTVRQTRWGYYGLTHAGPLAFLGEVAAGTDQMKNGGDVKTNSLAAWGEADWTPRREYNMRVRVDHLELDRASDKTIKDLNSFNRYALEGEWVPVPFAEIRWAFRVIDPVAKRDPSNVELKSEKQGFVQFHFSY